VIRAERVVVTLIDDSAEIDPFAVVRADAELISDTLDDADEVATVPVCVAVCASDSVAAAEADNAALAEWVALCDGQNEISADTEFETEVRDDDDADGELLALLETLAVPEAVERVEGDEREVCEDEAVAECCIVLVLAAVTLDVAVEQCEFAALVDAPADSDEELVEHAVRDDPLDKLVRPVGDGDSELEIVSCADCVAGSLFDIDVEADGVNELGKERDAREVELTDTLAE
jgi:hypothetical protein